MQQSKSLNELLGEAAPDGINVTGISVDSRKVKPGDVFFALSGSLTDGSRFVEQAIENGAIAVVASESAEINSVGEGVALTRVNDPRLALSKAAAIFYGAQPETMVAVTGTAGKTSVASFVRQIWEQAGLAAASIGTTGVVAPGREEYGNLTTPDAVTLHALLADLSHAGVTHASMEASSHGLDQCRLHGVQLSATAFTNLGRDHLDYHPTIEAYLEAKLRLFRELAPKGSPAIIFADDPFSEAAIEACEQAELDVWTVGRNGTKICLKRVEHERHRQIAELAIGGKTYRIEFPLAGDFQIANGLVAAGLAIATGVGEADALKHLEELEGAPGRLEFAGRTHSGAYTYVDYAHKPEALEKVLKSVRPFTTNRIVLVVGCGGDRDPGKREIMGEISNRLADLTIITDDNPRTEQPDQIRASIMKGNPDAIEIGDRARAIEEAVGLLEEGDSLIVAGKGHEEGQIVGNQVLPFNDMKLLQNLLSGKE